MDIPDEETEQNGPKKIPAAPEEKLRGQELFKEVHSEHQNNLEPAGEPRVEIGENPEGKEHFYQADERSEDRGGLRGENLRNDLVMAGSEVKNLTEEAVQEPDGGDKGPGGEEAHGNDASLT